MLPWRYFHMRFKTTVSVKQIIVYNVGSVQLLSLVQQLLTPWTAARHTSLHSLLKLMPSNQRILCRPFFSCLQSFPASKSFQTSQFFPSGGQSIGSFSFSISLSNEHPRLISFRMDWMDLLAVQGTLECVLQYHSSKALILQRSALFIVQLSHDHWKNRSLA